MQTDGPLRGQGGRGSGMVRTIVVVEHAPAFRRLIVRNLEARGHTVRHAGSTAAAGDTMLRQPPDQLILDINLPDGSGWDVLRKLQLHEVELPTIIISASRISPSLLDEFRPMAYLPKPFDLDALLEFVRDDS